MASSQKRDSIFRKKKKLDSISLIIWIFQFEETNFCFIVSKQAEMTCILTLPTRLSYFNDENTKNKAH